MNERIVNQLGGYGYTPAPSLAPFLYEARVLSDLGGPVARAVVNMKDMSVHVEFRGANCCDYIVGTGSLPTHKLLCAAYWAVNHVGKFSKLCLKGK